MLISMLLPIACSTSVSVQEQALKVAVIIDKCGAGSGVIYYHDKNTYQVLTNRHVVAPSKSPYIKGEINQSNCIVVPVDQTINTVEKIIFPLDNLDLAILQFSSDKEYQTVSLGDSQNVKVGDTVYIAGAPEKSDVVSQRAILVKDGKIESTTITDPNGQGYNLVYGNQTTKGMSGAPILDSGGKLIGIHGKTDVREGYKANLGIPIALFKNDVIPKSPVTPTPTNTPTPETTPDETNLVIPRSVLKAKVSAFLNNNAQGLVLLGVVMVIWGIVAMVNENAALSLAFIVVSCVIAGSGWVLVPLVSGVVWDVVWSVASGVVSGVVWGLVWSVSWGVVWDVVWSVASGVASGVVLGVVLGVFQKLDKSLSKTQIRLLIMAIGVVGHVVGYFGGNYLVSLL